MPKRHNNIVREALQMITAAGYEPTIVFGRHAKIRWQQNGRVNTLICSISSSDRWAIFNSRSVLRRLLRSAANDNRQGDAK